MFACWLAISINSNLSGSKTLEKKATLISFDRINLLLVVADSILSRTVYYSAGTAGVLRVNDHNEDRVMTVGATAASAAVKSFHDLNRSRLQQEQQKQQRKQHQIPSIGAGGRNVIVVQADVNPVADSIVNANSLSGSLRALQYDASKETLF